MENFIPTKLLKKLNSLCGSYDGNTATLQSFADSVANSIALSDEHGPSQDKTFSLNGLSGDDSRELFNALAVIFTTAAQNNLSIDKIKSFFQSVGAKQVVVDAISRSYQTHRTAMRTTLTSIGTDALVLCDVTYRLDFITKDSEVDDLREFRYAVTLIVQRSNDKSGALRELTFFCTMQQLQDIVAKFKLALSSVERLASSSGPVGVRAGGQVAVTD